MAAVSDTPWTLSCPEFDLTDLASDARLASNHLRLQVRDGLMPVLRQRFAGLSAADLGQRFEAIGLPCAPITRPQVLFDNAHLLANSGLAPISVPADASSAGHRVASRAALLPQALDGQRQRQRTDPPGNGQYTPALLRSLCYRGGEIDALREAGVIGVNPTAEAQVTAATGPPAGATPIA